MKIISTDNVSVSIISLDPPPLSLDRKIDNLKKIEIIIPSYLWKDKTGSIKVELSSP
jgi:hypothetical protein